MMIDVPEIIEQGEGKIIFELCEKYNLLGMQIENLYDEGNYYQFVPEKKKRLIECWSQGYQLFEQNEKSLDLILRQSN